MHFFRCDTMRQTNQIKQSERSDLEDIHIITHSIIKKSQVTLIEEVTVEQ